MFPSIQRALAQKKVQGILQLARGGNISDNGVWREGEHVQIDVRQTRRHSISFTEKPAWETAFSLPVLVLKRVVLLLGPIERDSYEHATTSVVNLDEKSFMNLIDTTSPTPCQLKIDRSVPSLVLRLQFPEGVRRDEAGSYLYVQDAAGRECNNFSPQVLEGHVKGQLAVMQFFWIGSEVL